MSCLLLQTRINLHVPIQRDQLGQVGPPLRRHVRLHGRHLPWHQVEVLGQELAKGPDLRTGKRNSL